MNNKNISKQIENKFNQLNENFSNKKDFENKYKEFSNITECEKTKKDYSDSKNFSSINDNHTILKNTNNVIKKLKEVNNFKCRPHNLDKNKTEDEKRYFYGGMDNNNNMKCYGINDCTLFENKKNCLENEKNIINNIKENNPQDILQNKTKSISTYLKNNEKLLEYEPIDEAHPGYIGDENIDSFTKYNNINCIPDLKDNARCKHLNERRIADIITLSEGNMIDDYEQIINNIKIFELYNKIDYESSNKEEYTEAEEIKERQVKYVIEPYLEEYKDMDPGHIFEHFTYKFKIKDDKKVNDMNITFNSIIEIYENNNFLQNMKDNNGDDFILKKGHSIHCFIDNNNKFNLNILDNSSQNETIILSTFKGEKKVAGDFGDDLNMYLRTNNVSMFENIKKIEKLDELIYPYNPFIEVEELIDEM